MPPRRCFEIHGIHISFPDLKNLRRPPNPPRISLSPFGEKNDPYAVSNCSIYVTSILSKNLNTAREDAAKSGGEAETALADALFRISWRLAAVGLGVFRGERKREKKSIIYIVYNVYKYQQQWESTTNDRRRMGTTDERRR